jgi:hypothetical protein
LRIMDSFEDTKCEGSGIFTIHVYLRGFLSEHCDVEKSLILPRAFIADLCVECEDRN